MRKIGHVMALSRGALLLLAVCGGCAMGERSGTSEPTRSQAGVREPDDVRAAVDRVIERLRQAMLDKDLPAIRRCASDLKDAYGPWAAVAESQSTFASPPDPDTPITRERLAALFEATWSAAQRGYRGNGRWGLPPDRPEVEHVLLRETAYVVSGALAAMRAGIGDHDALRTRADERLADLLSAQRESGLFPFPDVRSWHAHFGPPLRALYDLHPDAFENGWVIEDFGDGGLQFDNGVCAAVLLEAYLADGDERYRAASQRACRWAVGRPVVPNWNYNAFSVWALARYVEVTGDTTFLASAIEKARLGVLPGQLPNGRWVDRHNARTVYHGIILRGLATLYRVLPRDSRFAGTLRDAVERATATLVDELYTHGASDADHSLSGLYAARLALGGDDARREGAIRILINAMIAQEVERRCDVVDDLTLFGVGRAIEAGLTPPEN